MKKNKTLFLSGLLIHFAFNLLLLSTDSVLADYWVKDTGQLTETISRYQVDSRSYIQSADNFLKNGTFGHGTTVPDYHRTIGYPMFIAFFKSIIGGYWYQGLVIFQTLLGALIYPVIFETGKIIFPKKEKLVFSSVLITMFLGAYFTKSLYVLTDLSFSAFFLFGIYFSFKGVLKGINYPNVMLSLLCFTIAGLIRPTLIVYPSVHFLLLLFIAKRYEIWNKPGIKKVIVISSASLLILCNLSSMRVFYHYGKFSPTDILGINMFRFTSHSVLKSEGETKKYYNWKEEVYSKESWIERDKLRKEKFFQVLKNHPVPVFTYWTEAAITHLFMPHFMEVGTAYLLYKRDVDRKGVHLKKSYFMKGVFYIFFIVHFLIFLFFCFFIFEKMFINKQYLFAISFLALVLFLVGPSFLAMTSPRMRIPVSPFLILLALKFLDEHKQQLMKHIPLLKKTGK